MPTPDNEKYVLYFDDTGDSTLKQKNEPTRKDGMDWFGLGGILVKGEDVETIANLHQDFCEKYNIQHPLHSTKIRGQRKEFAWLGKAEHQVRADCFHGDLNALLSSAPIHCVACVIHRPGYFERYGDKHKDDLWGMSKTAVSILLERTVKFAMERNKKLEVVFEASGAKEDKALLSYFDDLKTNGLPFDKANSSAYKPLSAEDFSRVIPSSPVRQTKKSSLIQIADLVLYPMVKGGYEPTYKPYDDLRKSCRLLDACFEEKDISKRGIKYSCFD